ncbi:MAG: metallophosphoesterase [Anaerolineae bacterium]
MPNTSQSVYVDPLEHTPLHQLLVNTNRMQTLPAVVVLLIVAINAGLVALFWAGSGAVGGVVVLGYIITIVLNWYLLYMLRATGRSYGPEKPSVIALAIALAAILSLFGLLSILWQISIVILITVTAIVYYSTWVEPFRLGVTHQRYQTAKWSADASPLRLLQIGDIHVERVTPRDRYLNQLIDELKPDMIVFTGDFVNLSNTHDPESEAAIREIIGAWQAPLGVFCVSGTPLVEPLERVQDFVRGLENVKLLPDQWISINTPGGHLNILGLVVIHDMQRDRDNLKKMMLSAPKNGMHLLLMHPPDIAPEANELGIDLYLCGHTHGGQIRLPLVGALFSSSHLGNRFIMGRYELGNTTLYTSRGVGLEGLGAPRARFMCPPEIVLWEITGTGT